MTRIISGMICRIYFLCFFFFAIIGMPFVKFIFYAGFAFLLCIIVIISSNFRYFSLVINYLLQPVVHPTTQVSSFVLYEHFCYYE